MGCVCSTPGDDRDRRAFNEDVFTGPSRNMLARRKVSRELAPFNPRPDCQLDFCSTEVIVDASWSGHTEHHTSPMYTSIHSLCNSLTFTFPSTLNSIASRARGDRGVETPRKQIPPKNAFANHAFGFVRSRGPPCCVPRLVRRELFEMRVAVRRGDGRRGGG